MNGWLQDVRYALRQLRKSPGFTAVAVITLALGIGANTAIFSVVNTVLLAHLPYQNVDRLAMVWGSNPSRGDELSAISAGDFNDWKNKNDVFEDVAASYDNEVTLTGAGEPKLTLGYAFTPNYFRILGVAPRLGRTFTDDEATRGPSVAVISDKMWRSTLQGDPQILGRSITLNAKPYTVIGVMPPDFNYPPQTELWMPLALSPSVSGDYEHHYIRVIGRLKPGFSPAEAQTRMIALERQIAAAHPDTDAGNEVVVEPLRRQLTGDIRMPLLVLLGAVGFVLCIACANLASLLLARSAGRRKEVSIRVALGAGRVRLLRQSLTESLLLALLGGVLGVLLAFWCTHLLLGIFPNNVANLSIPKVESIPINASVLWFAVGVTLFTVMVFGGAPAMQSARANANDVLKESSRSLIDGSRSARLRRALIVAEFTLSLVLLTGAGLFVKSFWVVAGGDIGFRPDHLLALEIFLPPNRYPEVPPEKRQAFVSGVIGWLQTLPGVQSVAATNFLPLTGFWGTVDFLIDGHALTNADVKPLADNRLITPTYFSTMGMALLRGREFAASDRSDSEKVAIVNSALASRYFGAEDPLGKVLNLGSAEHPDRWRIVGLVSDVKAFGPDQPVHADLYRPLSQVSFPLLAFAVRTTGDPSALLKSSEQAIWDMDKDQPVFDAFPVSRLAAQSVTLRRSSTLLLAGFSTLALVLTAVGLYGLTAYTVAQRTQEIGIRMALGARRGDVLRLILGQGTRLVIIGEVIGIIGALALARLITGLLYGVRANDPFVFVAVGAMLALVALTACYVPARRATKTDPMVALRYE
jgi:putative ABC transport system permease protein